MAGYRKFASASTKTSRRELASWVMNPYARFLDKRDPLEVISHTADQLRHSVESLGPERVAEPIAAGKWSVHQIICHLADCEAVFAFRLRQTEAEPHHVI